MRDKTGKYLHIAMYPWFAFGHFTPFLNIANKLAKRGNKVSFFIPSKTQTKVAHQNHHPDLITFIPIFLPFVDGLPPEAETTNDVSALARILLMDAMELTQDTIDSNLARLKPDFIFYDFTPWVPGIARKHGVKSIYYVTSTIAMMAYSSLSRNLPHNYQITESDLIVPPPNFPCMKVKLRAYEARILASLVNMNLGDGRLSFGERHKMCFEECDAVAIKSCREIEGAYYEYLEKQWSKPILLTGPVILDLPTSTLDVEFDSWLNGFDRGSVVFCALGSECALEKHRFQELVLGLELTGRPFLAALKPPNGCETVERGLPEGYLERTKGRGMVHGGRVQQQLILKHPSVGCFLTHCGGGSLSESMLSECQLVMLPQAVDQFINARVMTLDFRVGVEVDGGEEDGGYTRDGICRAVDLVMDPKSKVGQEVRANHANLRNRLSMPGLEEHYMDMLVTSLHDLLD